MSDVHETRLIRKKRARAFNGRGAIYSWLRVHHTEVKLRREAEQRPWSVLIAEMVADQVRRDDGREPTIKNVSRIWERVCRDVAAENAAPRQGRKYPSRILPEWRPTIVPPPPTRHVANQPSAPAARLSAGNPAVAADDDMTPEGQAELDKIARILAEHDRKKFGF